MTEYATDTSEDIPEKDIAKQLKEELKPLEVKITNHPITKEISTSEDTEFIENYIPSEEEIKEMTDAQ